MAKWQQLLQTWEQQHTRQEKRDQGAIWTPEPLSQWMADWLLENNPQRVLDPAAGGGNLLAPFAALAANGQAGPELSAAEIDPELRAVLQHRFPGITISDDFWTISEQQRWPAIIANPPYINSRLIANKEVVHQQLEAAYGQRFPRSSNLALLFYLRCWQLLAPGGRMIFLIPTEFMQINSAEVFKRFLLQEQALQQVVELDAKELFGPEVISTACLALAEKRQSAENTQHPNADGGQPGIIFSRHSGREPFPAWEEQSASGQLVFSSDLDPDRRWINPGAGQQRRSTSGQQRQTLDALLDIKPGHITGDNRFFIISAPQAAELGISDSLQYILLRTQHLPTPFFHTAAQITELANSDSKRFLVDIGPRPSAAERRYLQQGEQQGIDQKPTFAARQPWWLQDYQCGYDFIIPNFRRTNYHLLAYWQRRRLAPMDFPTIQNMAFVRPEFRSWRAAIFAWLISASGQAALRSNERHAGNDLYTIRSGALKRVEIPLLQQRGTDWRDELGGQLSNLQQAVFNDQDQAPVLAEIDRLAR